MVNINEKHFARIDHHHRQTCLFTLLYACTWHLLLLVLNIKVIDIFSTRQPLTTVIPYSLTMRIMVGKIYTILVPCCEYLYIIAT